MVGIGGISMSAIAKHLFLEGYCVSGSDVAAGEEVQILEKTGIPVYIGHHPEKLTDVQVLIYTDAVPPDDPERREAERLGIACFSRMQVLAALAGNFPRTVTIAGSHGKTSATAMLAHIFDADGQNFTAHIGGRDRDFDNFFPGGKDIFLAEACEYKRNFLRLPAVDTAVLLNVDRDHMECYGTFSALSEAFSDYLKKGKRCVVPVGEVGIDVPENAVTFGRKTGDYRAVNLTQSAQRYAFTVLERGEKLCRIRLQVAGYFQVTNALAATAAARLQGVEPESIVRGLQSFAGVKRRFECMGKLYRAEAICDYAHHPTEIEKVISLAKSRAKGRLFVIFQPHTYSRTKLLMEEFVAALSKAENLLIYKTYAAREAYDGEGSAYALHRRIKNSLYAESTGELNTYLKCNASGGDILLFLGAGDIYYLAEYLIREQTKR